MDSSYEGDAHESSKKKGMNLSEYRRMYSALEKGLESLGIFDMESFPPFEEETPEEEASNKEKVSTNIPPKSNAKGKKSGNKKRKKAKKQRVHPLQRMKKPQAVPPAMYNLYPDQAESDTHREQLIIDQLRGALRELAILYQETNTPLSNVEVKHARLALSTLRNNLEDRELLEVVFKDLYQAVREIYQRRITYLSKQRGRIERTELVEVDAMKRVLQDFEETQGVERIYHGMESAVQEMKGALRLFTYAEAAKGRAELNNWYYELLEKDVSSEEKQEIEKTYRGNIAPYQKIQNHLIQTAIPSSLTHGLLLFNDVRLAESALGGPAEEKIGQLNRRYRRGLVHGEINDNSEINLRGEYNFFTRVGSLMELLNAYSESKHTKDKEWLEAYWNVIQTKLSTMEMEQIEKQYIENETIRSYVSFFLLPIEKGEVLRLAVMVNNRVTLAENTHEAMQERQIYQDARTRLGLPKSLGQDGLVMVPSMVWEFRRDGGMEDAMQPGALEEVIKAFGIEKGAQLLHAEALEYIRRLVAYVETKQQETCSLEESKVDAAL